MATIELYKSKINNMSNYIDQAKSAVGDFCVDLSALKSKILGINSSVCDSVVTSISTSSQTQEQQIAGLEATQREVNEFIDLTVNRDNSASSEISRAKNDFYKQYSYLKPDCEKTDWEKFCAGLKKVGQWCKDHWKEIVLVIEIVVAVVCICVPGLQGIGTGILIGALKGALTGGLIGGITSMLTGGSFLEGFAQGALDGAIMGGALGGVGGLAGKFITCGSKLGNAIQTTAKISGAMSKTMDGFDMVSLGMGMIDPDNPITELNNKLHQSDVYNKFQMGVSLVSSFTGAAADNMACFVAGTLVLTTVGLIEIEKLRVGDKIIAADPNSFEAGEKTILKAFERKVDKLVHLTINGEKIVTTDNHPFYVQERGFIQAGSLLVGDKLVNVNGEDLIVESYEIELTNELVTVYNFKVEDYHTYFVGENAVWVHNDDGCTLEFKSNNKDKDGEFKQQLSDQEKGLGDLTVDEYQKNRKAYNDRKGQTGNGRDPQSAKLQKRERNKEITAKMNEFMESGDSPELAMKKAKNWASDKAALHGPDQVAGGFPDRFNGLGDSGVNSSIGNQWVSQGNVDKLDSYVAQQLTDPSNKVTGSTKLSELDIKFVVKSDF